MKEDSHDQQVNPVLLQMIKDMCDPVEDGEPGAVNLQVRAGMTREEVVDTILEMVQTSSH